VPVSVPESRSKVGVAGAMTKVKAMSWVVTLPAASVDLKWSVWAPAERLPEASELMMLAEATEKAPPLPMFAVTSSGKVPRFRNRRWSCR
jgi:hypothetical protein